MVNPLIVNDCEIRPLVTPEQANLQDSVYGTDEYGEYVACRLGNRNGAIMYNWYILVSPRTLPLIQNYNWCGNAGSYNINVRRRENIDGKQYSFFLNKEVWCFFNKETLSNVYHKGHPLDFRIQRLSTCQHNSDRGVVWHKKGFWQVQITIHHKQHYVGIAPNLEEGYRMYNRALQKMKQQHLNNLSVQEKPYNTVIPRF